MAFINALNELDVPRSSGAVSGRFRAGCAARVLIDSVLLVTCRYLAVVRALGPACSSGGAGIPVFLGLARKIIRARAIKKRPFFLPQRENRFEWRSIAAQPGVLLRKTSVFALKVPKNIFSVEEVEI